MARACPAAIVDKPKVDIQIKGELGANHAKLLKDPVAALKAGKTLLEKKISFCRLGVEWSEVGDVQRYLRHFGW